MKIAESRLRQIIREEVKRSMLKEETKVYYTRYPDPADDRYIIKGEGFSTQLGWRDGAFTLGSIDWAKGSIAPTADVDQDKLSSYKGNVRIYAKGPNIFELKDEKGAESFGTFTLNDINGPGVNEFPKAGYPKSGEFPVWDLSKVKSAW